MATNMFIKGFLKSIYDTESNLTLLQLKNDLQKINQPTYIEKAVRRFYTLGFDYDEILPQKLVFMALCVLDNLITNNSFPEIQENTSVRELSPLIGKIKVDPLNLNQVNIQEYLSKHYHRKIIFESDNVSIVALQGDVFNCIDQFNVACLHIPDNWDLIGMDWNKYKNQTNLVERLDFNLLATNGNEIPEQNLVSITPSINHLNYLYLFENNRTVNNEEREIENRLHNCLNEVVEKAPLANRIVFNGLLDENYENIRNIQPFIYVLSNYFQNNNETNIKTIYIISKNKAILEI